MKYLKSFEYLNNYKVGDYIILKYSSLIFKIIKIEHKWSNPYFLEYYDNNNTLQSMNCRNEDIERRATPNEYENLKLKLDAKKYNI